MPLLSLALLFGVVGNSPRLLRFPAVHDNQLVFTYGGDLWTSTIQGGLARRLTAAPAPGGFPYFSPDGKELAFSGSYDGTPDVYVMPAQGGEPKRLTFEPEGDEVVGWTPDGKIAYVTAHGAPLERQTRLMLIDPKGGLPISTPLLEVGRASFSPDGAEIAYDRNPSNQMHWRRYRGGSQGVISIYNLRTNTYRELPHKDENSWDPIWVGRTIYYVSDRKAGTVNLYSYNLDTKQDSQLTDYTDSDIKSVRSDSHQIVFERNGYLYDMNIASHAIKQLEPEVLSDNAPARPTLKKLGTQITDFSLSPSGSRIAVAARGRLFTVPAHTGEVRSIAVSDSSRVVSPDWSPDGKWIIYLCDASGEFQVTIAPQMGATPKDPIKVVKTDPTYRLATVEWAPDSRHALATTRDGRLLIIDTESGALDQVAQADPAISNFDTSPDSRWIAYVRAEPNGFSAVWLYNVADKKSTRVTEGFYRDDAVSFDLTGKFLYLVSARTVNTVPGDFERGLGAFGSQRIYAFLLTKDEKSPLAEESDEEPTQDQGGPPGGGPPGAGRHGGFHFTRPPDEGGDEDEAKPIKIDLEGLSGRLVPLPMPAGEYGFIAGAEGGVFFSTPEGLFKYDLGAPEPASLIENAQIAISFNSSRTKLAYYLPGALGVVDAHPGIRPFEGRTDISGLETIVNPRKEWKEIYWDAWRWERDSFYDPKFTGVNWDAVGRKYAGYLDDLTDRSDLNYVLGMMIGELGTSHAFVEGGDYGLHINPVSVGQLGADFDVHQGHIRFKHIYRGLSFDEAHRSPLAEPGLNVADGDYLLEIDGLPVTDKVDPNSLLIDKAGRSVTLTINSKPSLDGSRMILVHPLASEADVRYTDWVEQNRAYVSKISGGRIGYMYVPDTDTDGIAAFIKGFYSQSDKEALIVDERWNSGGDIPTFFTEKLSRSLEAVIRDRYGHDFKVPEQAIEGPKVLLVNGYSGSGGDLFAYLFRKEHLGTLIGTRTWGGLVGFSEPYQLEDGGQLTAPQFGLYDPADGKWIAENHGIDPDITVDLRPDLVADGRDPQLDRAVQVLMEKLKHGGAPKPSKSPAYPDSVRGR